MSAQQTLARDLLAAGTTIDPKDNSKHQLVVDSAESSLTLQTWKGENLEGEELVVASVRANSTATLLLASSGKVVICITPSSKLAAYNYDDDESEWVESKDHPVSKYTVHAEGKVASITSPSGKSVVVFQDANKKIALLDSDWKLAVAPLDALSGTPISILGDENHQLLFYISSVDNSIHVSAHKDGEPWLDRVAIEHAFTEQVKAFVVGDKQSEAFVLTGKNSLIKVDDDGKKVLGTVKGGSFVSGTTEENVMSMSYSNPGWTTWTSPDGSMSMAQGWGGNGMGMSMGGPGGMSMGPGGMSMGGPGGMSMSMGPGGMTMSPGNWGGSGMSQSSGDGGSMSQTHWGGGKGIQSTYVPGKGWVTTTWGDDDDDKPAKQSKPKPGKQTQDQSSQQWGWWPGNSGWNVRG